MRGRAVDKFAEYEAKEDLNGNPYLTDHMVARISCKVVGQMEVGNYILFVAEAADAEVLGVRPVARRRAVVLLPSLRGASR